MDSDDDYGEGEFICPECSTEGDFDSFFTAEDEARMYWSCPFCGGKGDA